jgi:hypothetical protein
VIGAMRRPIPAAAAALTLAAGAFAGCGGSSPKTSTASVVGPQAQPQTISQAARATRATGTARVTLSGSVRAVGRTLPISGRGAIDLRHGVTQLRLGTQVPAAGKVDLDGILTGQVLYVHSDRIPSFLLGGKNWVKVDLAQAAKARGADLGLLKSLSGGGDPSQYLTWLAVAGDPKEVGKEQVDGVDTTHYRARVDVRKLAQAADPSTRRSVEQLGVETVPVDVWIDGNGLVRREHLVVTSDKARTPVTLDLTIGLADHGKPVSVTPPAGGDVYDATGVASSALRLLG